MERVLLVRGSDVDRHADLHDHGLQVQVPRAPIQRREPGHRRDSAAGENHTRQRENIIVKY